MIKIDRGTNPNDKSCDGCENILPHDKEHVKIIIDTGPGPNRVIDLCEGCDVALGVQVIQQATLTLDFRPRE